MLLVICNGPEMRKYMQGASLGEESLAPTPSLSPKLTEQLGAMSSQPSAVAFASHPTSLPEGSARQEMPQGPLSAMLSYPTLRTSLLMQQDPTLAPSHVPSPGHTKQPILQARPLQPQLGALQQEQNPPDRTAVPPTASLSGSPAIEPGWLPPAPELLQAGSTLADPSAIKSRCMQRRHSSEKMVEASWGSLEQTSSIGMHAPEHAISANERLEAQVSSGDVSRPASGGPMEISPAEVGARYTLLPGVDGDPMLAVAQPPVHEYVGTIPAAEQPALASSAAAASTAELVHASSGYDLSPTAPCVPRCPSMPGGVSETMQASARGIALPPACAFPTYPFRPRGGMYPAVPLELLGTLKLPIRHLCDPPHASAAHTGSLTDEVEGNWHRQDRGSTSASTHSRSVISRNSSAHH